MHKTKGGDDHVHGDPEADHPRRRQRIRPAADPACQRKRLHEWHGRAIPEEFREWLCKSAESAEKTEIEDGWRVPQAIYWLYLDGKPVGMGKLRYFLTDALRHSGGHIGYAIAPDARGKGCGTALLQGLLHEAALHGVTRALITVNNDNPASIRVAQKCGGVVERISGDHHYIWCDCK